MSIFYQHIGQELWKRDAPKSLGTCDNLKRFHIADIEEYLSDVSPWEAEALKELEESVAQTGFQIWGLPSGASKILAPMVPGDFIMFLETTEFKFIGQVLHKISTPSWSLSHFIWGEQSYPLIIFIQGRYIDYSWDEFKTDFGFDQKYHMRGNTMRLGAHKFPSAKFENELEFVTSLLALHSIDFELTKKEFQLFAELSEKHLQLVRDRAAQGRFREEVLAKHDMKCALCGFDVIDAVEAAHLVPKKAKGGDDSRNGIALCSLHHKLFDRKLFYIDPDTRDVISTGKYTLEQMRISNTSLQINNFAVHEDALRWNMEHQLK